MSKLFFVAAILFLLLHKISSICNKKYVNFCDCVSDLGRYNRVNWTDVIVDSTKQSCLSSVIESSSFDSLEDVKLLFLVNCTNGVEKNAFKTIGQTLKNLRFYGNELEVVKSEMFSGFRKLSRLSLTNNGIQSIEKFSFAGSVIKNLDLSNNLLESILEDAFNGGKINTVVINNNKLSYINEKAFNGYLDVLKLDYNNLEYLEEGFLTKMVNLKELTLSHNKLFQIAGINTLVKLQKLDLSFNNIKVISDEDLEDLKELVYLDLSNNRLETFSLKGFKKNKAENMVLSVSFNLLTNVRIPDNTKPMTLSFFGNPWNCKCLANMEEKMILYNFTTSKCNLKLLRAGTFPICLEQGECRHRPTEIRRDLQRFIALVHQQKQDLPCDLFREIKPKDIISMT